MSVAALVLAAGGSARLGQPKQLLQYRGQPLVRHAVTAALEADCRPVVVVVGRDRTEVAQALQDLPVEIVPNDFWKRGIGGSIRLGLKALEDCTAVAIVACDQPHLQPELIRRLRATQEKTGKPIVASAYAGTIGIPALFARPFFAALMTLHDSQGAKTILTAHPGDVATVCFPEGATDIDTLADYHNLPNES